MTARSVLARGRRRHRSLLLDSCLIKRKTDETVDEATDQITPVYSTIYDSPTTPGAGAPCRVKPFQSGHNSTAGESPLQLQRYEIQLPWDAGSDVLEDDLVIITATDDAGLLAWTAQHPFVVTDPLYNGTATVRHIVVEART